MFMTASRANISDAMACKSLERKGRARRTSREAVKARNEIHIKARRKFLLQ